MPQPSTLLRTIRSLSLLGVEIPTWSLWAIYDPEPAGIRGDRVPSLRSPSQFSCGEDILLRKQVKPLIM